MCESYFKQTWQRKKTEVHGETGRNKEQQYHPVQAQKQKKRNKKKVEKNEKKIRDKGRDR
jgi:hypothetical protein